LLPELAEALTGLGKFPDARMVLKEAHELAGRTHSSRIAASATVIGCVVRLHSREADGESEDPLDLVQRIRPVLEREGANNELANAWRLVLTVHAAAGRYSEASESAQQALKYARLAGNDRAAARVALVLGSISLFGPMPVVEAIRQCEGVIQQGLSDRVVEASLLCTLASLRAMNGELQVARSLYQRGREMLVDLGGGVRLAATGIHMGLIELHDGDLAAAEDRLRRDVDDLDSVGERWNLSSVAVLLAKVIRERGRDSDALPLLDMAERLASPHDVTSQADWRAVRAPIVARQGKVEDALQLAMTAVELLEKTESPAFKADALCELATVLSLAGKKDEAIEALDKAAELYRLKGDQVAFSRIDRLRNAT
jgi:tetratricopeptide (TPR) repeat protein